MKIRMWRLLSVLSSMAFSLTSVAVGEAGGAKKKTVAEPSTFVLLAVGAGALAWWNRRK